MDRLNNTTLGLGEHPALLVVDASCAFTDPASPLGSDFTKEIEAICVIMEIASRLNWPRLFSTVWYESDSEASVFREKLPALNMLTPDDPAVSVDGRLAVSIDDRVFRKTHASSFFGTELDLWLRSENVDSLVVTGFTTSGCVRATVVDALQHNYRTLVVSDAVGDRDPAAHRANLYDISAKYGDVCTLSEFELVVAGKSWT